MNTVTLYHPKLKKKIQFHAKGASVLERSGWKRVNDGPKDAKTDASNATAKSQDSPKGSA